MDGRLFNRAEQSVNLVINKVKDNDLDKISTFSGCDVRTLINHILVGI